MPELEGALAGIGLPALVRFLAGLKATGRLRVEQDGRTGDLWLDGGRVVAAACGGQQGRPALDAVALLLSQGRFALTAAPPPAAPAPEIDLAPEALDAHLEQLTAAAPELASLLAAEWATAPPEAADGLPEQVVLDRGAVRALLAVAAGRRTAEAIAAGSGLVEAATALRGLRDLGLVLAGPPGPPLPAAAEGRATADQPEPAAAPPPPEWVALPPEEVGDLGGTVDLDPVTIETFLAVKAGKRTVEEIAAGRGLDETVEALHRLRAMGLVREQPPGAAPLPPQPPAAADLAEAPPAGDAGPGRRFFRPRST